MIIKFIAYADYVSSDQLIEIIDDGVENINRFQDLFDDIKKDWRMSCKGSYHTTEMFDKLHKIYRLMISLH